MIATLALAAAFAANDPIAAPPAPTAGSEPAVKLVLTADWIYTAAGDPIPGGTIVVGDGSIVSVTPGLDFQDGALNVAAITPGLVDLSPRINLADLSVEESLEVVTDLPALWSADLSDDRWARLARSGVTTALLAPADEDCIGGIPAVVKTDGAGSLWDRIVLDDAGLRGTMGSQASRGNHPAYGRPTDHFSRRPTTRMGVEWEHRRAFYDAIAAPRVPGRAFEGWEVLAEVMGGDRTFWVQASATQDVRTAIYLKEEFSIPRMVIDSAAEVWKEPELIRRSGAAVVLPPFGAQGTTDVDGGFMAWNTGRVLADLGVPFALSSHGASGPLDNLGMQAAYAIRGGLTFDEALAAVTASPAAMAGVADRVGTIEVGKDADLVLWSGRPFAPTSRVLGVVIDGSLVYQAKQ